MSTSSGPSVLTARLIRLAGPLVMLALVGRCNCNEDDLGDTQATLELPATFIDFGAVQQGTEKLGETPVRNVGDGVLEVQARLSADSSADFELVTNRLTIGVAQGVFLQVRFRPGEGGSDTGLVELSTNDPDLPNAQVDLRGGPIFPSIRADPSPLDFSPATTAIVQRVVTLHNDGMAVLNVRGVGVDPQGNPDFSVQMAELPVARDPGGTLAVTISYARSLRIAEGAMLVLSDDPFNPTLTVRLVPDAPGLCGDSADNDADGLTDFPDDPGCSDESDDDEYNPPECVDDATQPCGRDTGACEPGVRTCRLGRWSRCEGEVIPVDETCDDIDENCNGDRDDGVSEACVVNGCAGARACIANSGVEGGAWTACLPINAPAETCDGQDNDCDGSTDEGIVESCLVNGCGGERICVPGGPAVFTECVALDPQAEVCDGTDNDCDGNTDEDIAQTTCGEGSCAVTVAGCSDGGVPVCTPGSPVDEQCNGFDDDCDGNTDNPAPLSCGLGVCAVMVDACLDGDPVECSPADAGSAEICNALDDDCDGTTDELAPITCGLGICATTVAACSDGGPNLCVPGQSANEQCNSLDDDCDGVTDNLDPLSCGVGACARTLAACGDGGPNICVEGEPATESCNTVDDNCDGVTDELPAITCGVGACERTVPGCWPDGGAATCTEGSPQVESCNAVDDNCDGTTDELAPITCGQGACERTVPGCLPDGGAGACVEGAPSNETCNGADDDCDGTTDNAAPITCGRGGCERTVPGCLPDGGTATCVEGLPEAESCNNVDDNCDGATDELPPVTCGTGACASSVPGCVGGAPGNCVPNTGGSEACSNNIDDNCDGQTDEGCSSCNVNGTYNITSGVAGNRIQYQCCDFGLGPLVDVDVSEFVFQVSGADISPTPKFPVNLSGTATTCPSGDFDAVRVINGTCTETYRLIGGFTGPDTWSGTLRLTFTGDDCGCWGIDVPCENQLYSIEASR